MASDMRYYETFYGIHSNTDKLDFGSGVFNQHNKQLVKEYINEGCSTTDTSLADEEYKFLYPHHIKKVYFIEGVITGHITIAATADSTAVPEYRVTVCKVDSAGNEDELFSTGWKDPGITLNDEEEVVLNFSIDAWEKEKLGEYERIYLKVQTIPESNAVLWHSNDAQWEDVMITIPFKL